MDYPRIIKGPQESFRVKPNLSDYNKMRENFRWEEAGVTHEIGVINKGKGDYEYGMVNFPPEQARYVRFRITETRKTFPYIGEFMIFGKEE